MNDSKRLKELHKDKHPGFGSYLECMSRATFSGLVGFVLGKHYIYIHFMKILIKFHK